jgi:DNA replication and repair protein RecF
MPLEKIKILRFRNHKEIEIEGVSATNLLIGENGSGKTNFLEAIFLLCRASPFRSVSFSDLIQWNENSFYIGGLIDNLQAEIGYSLEKKVLKINSKTVSFQEFTSNQNVLTFLPEDIFIASGSPEDRRGFIDKILSSLDSEYFFALQRYHQALKQRNSQLKLAPKDAFIWNEELIRWGSKLIEKRLTWTQLINKSIRPIYYDWYQQEIELKYLNTFKIENSIADSFAKTLEKTKIQEVYKKCTQTGPHRDNFEILSRAKNSRFFASQGQKRAISLALKLCFLENSEKIFGGAPILLIDDVLLELDANRREKFLERIGENYQTFFTATSKELLPTIQRKARVFRVENGMILG